MKLCIICNRIIPQKKEDKSIIEEFTCLDCIDIMRKKMGRELFDDYIRYIKYNIYRKE